MPPIEGIVVGTGAAAGQSKFWPTLRNFIRTRRKLLAIGVVVLLVIIAALVVVLNRGETPPEKSSPQTETTSDSSAPSAEAESSPEQTPDAAGSGTSTPGAAAKKKTGSGSTSTGGGGTGGGSSGSGGSSGGGSGGGSSPTCPANPPQHVPGGNDGTGTCWPGAANTGVPSGTVLGTYTGPCTITAAGTTIDAKTVNCDLTIQAANVTIRRSKINGVVSTDENSTGYSFTISDTEVSAGNRVATGIGAVNFTATRVHVYGGSRSIHCWHDCTVTDSYVHGQFRDNSGTAHESGMRMGQSATFRHNSILCDAPDVPPDAGCSADLTGYGDFGPVQNNTIDHNLFLASTGGFCAYGGSSGGKPYSSQTNHITFTSNIFQRGTSPNDHGNYTCAYYGAITDFSTSAPGNVWSGNKYDDGTVLLP